MTAPTPAGSERFPTLGQIVGDLRNVSQNTGLQDGLLPELPSRKAIIDIIDSLVAALFPRHFGPPGLTPSGTDAFLIDTLATTLGALQQQVACELRLAAEQAAPVPVPSDPAAHGAHAFAITNRFADALPRVRILLDSDIRAAYEGDPAAKSLDEVVFCYPGITAMIRHRLAHLLYRQGVPMLARIIAEIAHAATGIDIHPGATIGESFFIDHGTGVVIGETAIIGRRVRLYQAVTLGARRFEVDHRGALVKNYPRHPIVEDDVVIYAGATILGRITIGRGSSIAGNVWLTESVPPGSNISQAKPRSEAFGDGGGI